MIKYNVNVILQEKVFSEDVGLIALPPNLLQHIALFIENPVDIRNFCRSCKMAYYFIYLDSVWWKNYYLLRFRKNHNITRWLYKEDDTVIQFVKHRCLLEKKIVDTTNLSYFKDYESVPESKMTELNELLQKFYSIVEKWDIYVAELGLTQRSYGFQIHFKLCFYDQETIGRCFELLCYNSYLVTRGRKAEFLTATEMHLTRLNEHIYGYSDHYFSFWNVSEILESSDIIRPNKDICITTKSKIMCALNLSDNSWGQFFEYLNLYW